jgi:hypothetical protein
MSHLIIRDRNGYLICKVHSQGSIANILTRTTGEWKKDIFQTMGERSYYEVKEAFEFGIEGGITVYVWVGAQVFVEQ